MKSEGHPALLAETLAPDLLGVSDDLGTFRYKDVLPVVRVERLCKHAELNRPSRSGLSPRFLQPAHTTLEFKITTSEETPILTIPVFGGGQFQAHGGANVRITATVVDKDGNTLGELEPICLKAVAAWEAELVKAGLKIVPPPERQKEYARLSGQLQAIGLRHRSEQIGRASCRERV